MSIYTIAFYNTENLFDIYDDHLKNDDDFLPTSDKRWTKKRYERKLYKLGSVISKIGVKETNKPPSIIGLVEVENKLVLEDLLQSSDLKNHNYNYVHHESNDERGIDVAMLYNEDDFILDTSETFSINIVNEQGERDYTRDILLVSGILNREKIYCIINHWPSRREGEKESAYKRMLASKKVEEIIQNLKSTINNPKIIIMGDFNDNPNNESIEKLVNNNNLYNPMESLQGYNIGTQNHDFQWNIFDQIFFTSNFFETSKNTLKFKEAMIFNNRFLTQYEGKFKGQPFRTYIGKKYKGGFSDHFPVYILLQKNK